MTNRDAEVISFPAGAIALSRPGMLKLVKAGLSVSQRRNLLLLSRASGWVPTSESTPKILRPLTDRGMIELSPLGSTFRVTDDGRRVAALLREDAE